VDEVDNPDQTCHDEEIMLDMDYVNIFPKDLMDRLKNDLEYINHNLPEEKNVPQMFDSFTQTDIDDIEKNNIDTNNRFNENIPEMGNIPDEKLKDDGNNGDDGDDENIFSSLIDYMFGNDGVITNLFNNIPTIDDIKSNFKESSFYKLLDFLFK